MLSLKPAEAEAPISRERGIAAATLSVDHSQYCEMMFNRWSQHRRHCNHDDRQKQNGESLHDPVPLFFRSPPEERLRKRVMGHVFTRLRAESRAERVKLGCGFGVEKHSDFLAHYVD